MAKQKIDPLLFNLTEKFELIIEASEDAFVQNLADEGILLITHHRKVRQGSSPNLASFGREPDQITSRN